MQGGDVMTLQKAGAYLMNGSTSDDDDDDDDDDAI
jgi:hypothetical protein